MEVSVHFDNVRKQLSPRYIHAIYKGMSHNPHHDLYSALLARDVKFDGMLFVGVKTTGVYCRSICPATILYKYGAQL